MTPIESIYEIKAAVLDLQRYLGFKDPVVPQVAKMKYKKFVNRFFRENANIVDAEKRTICFEDIDSFFKLMESTIEYYYFS